MSRLDAGDPLARALRSHGGRLRAGLVALTGCLDAAEDALQDACARALVAWPRDGVPERPGAWLATVARRSALDALRRPRAVACDRVPEPVGHPVEPRDIDDDLLRLIFTCCHPALSQTASVPLALKVLCGLDNAEIARAFGLKESAAAQRIVRAKRKIRRAGIRFELPGPARFDERIGAVHSVIYAVFTEGHVATAGDALMRPRLADEAIRLGRLTARLMPPHAETLGLLALMLLVDARRAARIDRQGRLVPLDRQDRTAWDRERIEEGEALLDRAMALGRPGPYQVEAAIAALHDRAPSEGETDWRQILLLYRRLLGLRPGPVVALNAAIAEAMVDGQAAGLARIDRLQRGDLDIDGYLTHAARAELLRRLGRTSAAIDSYRRALVDATNGAERRYLESRVAELGAT